MLLPFQIQEKNIYVLHMLIQCSRRLLPAARRVLRGGSVASDSSWHPVWLGHTHCFSGGTAEGPPSHLCCHLHACGVSVCGLDFFA